MPWKRQQQPGVKIITTLPVPLLLLFLCSILGLVVMHSAINSTPLQYHDSQTDEMSSNEPCVQCATPHRALQSLVVMRINEHLEIQFNSVPQSWLLSFTLSSLFHRLSLSTLHQSFNFSASPVISFSCLCSDARPTLLLSPSVAGQRMLATVRVCVCAWVQT